MSPVNEDKAMSKPCCPVSYVFSLFSKMLQKAGLKSRGISNKSSGAGLVTAAYKLGTHKAKRKNVNFILSY